MKEKAQIEIGHLNGQLQDELLAKEILQAQIQESNKKVIELQKTLDLRTEEHAKKEQEAYGKLDDARQELEKVIEDKCQLETTIGNLQENIASLSCSLSEAERHKETLMITISKLQTENKDAYESFQLTLQQKEEENKRLLEKQETEITQLQRESLNKAQMIVQCQERIKELEEQNDKESFSKAQVIAQVQEGIKELEEQNDKFIHEALKLKDEKLMQLKRVFSLASDEGEVVTKYDKKRKFPFSGEENGTPVIPMICNEEAVPRKSLLLDNSHSEKQKEIESPFFL